MYMDMSGVMVKYPYVASTEMSLEEANLYMKECRIRHLPVVKENKLVGVVSDRDIKCHLNKHEPHNLNLGDIMITSPFVVHQEVALSHCVHVMAEKKIGSVLITNDDNHLVGIFTTTDALKVLEQLLDGEPEFLKRAKLIKLKEVVSWN